MTPDQLRALARQIHLARERTRDHVRLTPVEWLPKPSPDAADIALKLECFQRTGSFKLRGAMNCVRAMDEGQRQRGVIAASTGNHGMAVAAAAATCDTTATVFVPEGAHPSKLATIRALGGTIQTAGRDCVEAERAGRAFAESHAQAYISPYNDARVVAGQGTIGLELAEQCGALDAVFVAVGGGGLVGGIGAALHDVMPGVEVVACSPERSAVMHASWQAGRLLDLPSEPTLSDGTAGGVEEGSITWPLFQQVVDRSLTVSEDAIATAMRELIGTHHILVEGAAAVPLAALRSVADQYRERRVAVIVCGANVGLETLREVLTPAQPS